MRGGGIPGIALREAWHRQFEINTRWSSALFGNLRPEHCTRKEQALTVHTSQSSRSSPLGFLSPPASAHAPKRNSGVSNRSPKLQR